MAQFIASHQPQLPAQTSISEDSYRREELHERHVLYHMHINDHNFLVELDRCMVLWCTCENFRCQHGKQAEVLERLHREQQWDLERGSCTYCGRLCRRANGFSVCPQCLI